MCHHPTRPCSDRPREIARPHPVRRAVVCDDAVMRLLQRSIGLVRRPMAERHARGRDLGDLGTELEASGRALDARMADLADTPAHRAVLAHWVGIERWGQRRLRVALGEPLLDDGHHPYRPDEADGTAALRQAFAATRSATIGLALELREAGVDPATTVRHNDLGDLTIAGWLAYLLQHPEQEARARLRP
jgi:hypothetical protein